MRCSMRLAAIRGGTGVIVPNTIPSKKRRSVLNCLDYYLVDAAVLVEQTDGIGISVRIVHTL